MTETIYIDSRERGIIVGAFEYMVVDKGFDFEIKQKQLPVGDVLCQDIVIERKDEDKGDFISSMINKDRRLESQLESMQQFKHKYVIIIGDPYNISRDIHRNCVSGMISKMVVDYGIPPIYVPTTNDYVYTTLTIIDRIINPRKTTPTFFFGERRKLSQKEVIINMIGQIQGVGYERAKTIVEDFNIDYLSDLSKITPHNYNGLKEDGFLEGIGEKVFNTILSYIWRENEKQNLLG